MDDCIITLCNSATPVPVPLSRPVANVRLSSIIHHSSLVIDHRPLIFDQFGGCPGSNAIVSDATGSYSVNQLKLFSGLSDHCSNTSLFSLSSESTIIVIIPPVLTASCPSHWARLVLQTRRPSLGYVLNGSSTARYPFYVL